MTVKLLTEQTLEFLSLTRGCTGSSESILVTMPHYRKSHVAAQLNNTNESQEVSPFLAEQQIVQRITNILTRPYMLFLGVSMLSNSYNMCC